MFNLTTYPHLVGFLEGLGVDTEPSDMSFGMSLDRGRLEWASHGLHSIFAQRSNLLDPRFWLMIYHVIRFGKKAPEVDRQCLIVWSIGQSLILVMETNVGTGNATT